VAIKPGKPAIIAGQYRPVGGGAEVTVPAGHRLPPSARPGVGWILTDATKHKR
jgi:hypothetical protein